MTKAEHLPSPPEQCTRSAGIGAIADVNVNTNEKNAPKSRNVQEQDDIGDLVTVAAAANKTPSLLKGVVANKSAKKLYKFIKGEQWNEVLRHLSYNESDCKQWIEEVNDDRSKRWRSLPIHLVCEQKPPMEVVNHLVLLCPESLTAKNYGEDLPLHIACREHASNEVIEFLLQKNYNTASKTDCEGRLPLHHAVSHPLINIKTLQDLILFFERAPRVPDDYGLLPLHYACMKKAAPSVIETLLKANPFATERRDSYGRLPMDLAKFKPSPLVDVYKYGKGNEHNIKKGNDDENNGKDDNNGNDNQSSQSHDQRAKTIELLSRDPSSWKNAMMSTIVSLSHKVHAAEEMQNNFESRMKQIKVLMDQNARSDQEVICLQSDITLLERHFETQIRIIQNDYHHQLATLKREKEDIDRRSNDLKTLVEELVEQLKDQTTRVEDQGTSRKELKERVMTLIQHLDLEKQNVSQQQEEQDTLLGENAEIVARIEEKECELDEWYAREEELVKMLRREQDLGDIFRDEKDKYVMSSSSNRHPVGGISAVGGDGGGGGGVRREYHQSSSTSYEYNYDRRDPGHEYYHDRRPYQGGI